MAGIKEPSKNGGHLNVFKVVKKEKGGRKNDNRRKGNQESRRAH